MWMLLSRLRQFFRRRRERKADREWEQERMWRAIEVEYRQRGRKEGPINRK